MDGGNSSEELSGKRRYAMRWVVGVSGYEGCTTGWTAVELKDGPGGGTDADLREGWPSVCACGHKANAWKVFG